MWSSQNPNIYPALRLTGQGGTPFFFAFLQSRRSAEDFSFSNYGT